MSALGRALSSASRDLHQAAGEFDLAVAGSARRLLVAERDTLEAAVALAACRGSNDAERRALLDARRTLVASRRAHDRNREAKLEFERIATSLLAVLHETARSAEAGASAVRNVHARVDTRERRS